MSSERKAKQGMEQNEWWESWRPLYEQDKNIERKNGAEYWTQSFYFLRTLETPEAMRDEYIGHHLDFFRISIIAQAARDGKIPHSDVTKAVLLMIGVDDDPGDTEVPVGWDGI